MGRKNYLFAVLTAVALVSPTLSDAATVVVSHDEWPLSDTGFSQSPGASTFVQNLVTEFGNRIHAYSANFGLTESSFSSAMSTAGATFTAGTGFDFTLANLAGIDAVMLAGTYLDAAGLGVLADYVAGGGSVYIAGGTGVSGAAGEAAAWNSFLALFGIQMTGGSYDGISGNLAVSGDPIFAGVSTLYSNNGNALTGDNVVCCGSNGLYAVWRSDDAPAPVPLPASGVLLAGGIGTAAALRRRKRAA